MLKVLSPRTRPEEVLLPLLPLLLLLPLLPLAGAANTTTCNRPVVSSVAWAGSTTVKLQLMLLGFIPPPLFVAARRAVAPFWSVGHTTAAATVGPVSAAAVGAAAVELRPLLLLLLLSPRLELSGPAGRPINAISRSAPVCGVCRTDLGPVTAAADCVTAERSIGAAGRGRLLVTASISAIINFRKPLLFETCCRWSRSTLVFLRLRLLLLPLLRDLALASVALTRTSMIVNALSVGLLMTTTPASLRVKLLTDRVTYGGQQSRAEQKVCHAFRTCAKGMSAAAGGVL